MSVGPYLEVLSRLDHFTDHTVALLRAALAQDLSGLGLLGKAIVHSENVWGALQSAQEGIAYFQPRSSIEIRLRQGRCRLVYSQMFGSGSGPLLDIQYSIGVLTNLLQESPHFAASNVIVRYPGAKSDHETLFGNSVKVVASEQGVIDFDDTLLKSPLRRSDPDIVAVVVDAMKALSEDLDPSKEYTTLVHSLQIAALERKSAPLQQNAVAKLLDLSPRMLQYYLRKEGARFDMVRDMNRHAIARRGLLRGKSISEVARETGFAHRQGFSEAFSKWEGMSPSVFRSRGFEAE